MFLRFINLGMKDNNFKLLNIFSFGISNGNFLKPFKIVHSSSTTSKYGKGKQFS